MTSDLRNTEFRNLLSGPTVASAIHPRLGETTAFDVQEDHGPGTFNISALHRDSKPGTIRGNFASRIQSLMSGEVGLGSLGDHGAGPPSTLVMSSPGGGIVANGSVSPGSGGMQAEAQQDQSNRAPSRYEAQKRRDWNTFGQYLRNHRPPLALARCTGVHVLEFVRYLDQFGKTKVHNPSCPFFGLPHPPHPCPCPLRQAWGSLDALIGRLRAAFEENGGKPESNPFGARQVRLYLREVREMQAKARGIAYEKKKRKRMPASSEGGASGVNTLSISNGVGVLSNGNVLAPQLATQQ